MHCCHSVVAIDCLLYVLPYNPLPKTGLWNYYYSDSSTRFLCLSDKKPLSVFIDICRVSKNAGAVKGVAG